MANQVELSVKTDLEKVIDILTRIKTASGEIPEEMKKSTKGVDDEVRKQGAAVEQYLSGVMRLGSRFANNLKDDFKSLFNIGKIASGLQISKQFGTVAKEAFDLSDTIRRLGPVFKLTGDQFQSFQVDMVKGLGELGLSSDVAVDALNGLSETPVRNHKALIEYSKTAGQLASLAGERGHEGGIAKGMANVQVARGRNPENIGEMKALGEDLRRVFNQTGAMPSKSLEAMQRLFENMPDDLRKQFTTRGAANVAATEQVGGPNVDKFLEEYLHKSKLKRLPFEAQGLNDSLINDKGLDTKKFKKFYDSITKRIGFDPQAAAETLGISEEAANGFIRLGQSLDKVKAATDAINNATGDVTDQMKKSRGAAESYKASLNRTKGFAAGPIATVTNMVTDVLSKASQSDEGAAAVTAGSAIVAAMLTGGGLKGLMTDFVGGSAKEKAYEAITGEQVQKVWVVNASDIAAGTNSLPGAALGALGGFAAGGGAAAAGGGAAVAGGAASMGAAPMIAAGVAGAALGVGAGGIINDVLKTTDKTNDQGFTGDALERGMFQLARAIDALTGIVTTGGKILPGNEAPPAQKVKIDIDIKSAMLKVHHKPPGGMSN